jgi:hypothetical protein
MWLRCVGQATVITISLLGGSQTSLPSSVTADLTQDHAPTAAPGADVTAGLRTGEGWL